MIWGDLGGISPENDWGRNLRLPMKNGPPLLQNRLPSFHRNNPCNKTFIRILYTLLARSRIENSIQVLEARSIGPEIRRKCPGSRARNVTFGILVPGFATLDGNPNANTVAGHSAIPLYDWRTTADPWLELLLAGSLLS